MVLTNTGKQEILDWIVGNSATAPSHIGVGTGTTAANVTQTALGTEVYPDAVDRNSIVTGTRTGRQATVEIVVASTELTTDPSITEVGSFNASTAGDMFTRSVFNGVAKDADTEIQVIDVFRFL